MHIPEPDPSAPLLTELRRLRRAGSLTPHEARRLAQDAAARFRTHYAQEEAFLPDTITLLTELATSPNAELARIGAEQLFPALVEWSADRFDPTYCRLYDRLFAQVIDICRHLPENRELHFLLYGYGITNIDDILARRAAQRAQLTSERIIDVQHVKKVLIPSRVTFGAEVAVTSVILAMMHRLCPAAECVILGAPVVGQLFAGDAGVRVEAVGYPRDGSLLARLDRWVALTQVVADELAGLDHDEYLIIDPDSRLTQLGLLPLTMHDARSLFFESRSYGGDGTERIGALTARWLIEQFGGDDTAPAPYLSLSDTHAALGTALRQALLRPAADVRPIVCVGFGVGGNDAKRIDDDFEHSILRALIESGARLLFVKGVGDEVIRAERHLGRLNALGGIAIAEAEADDAAALPPPDVLRAADVVAWRGELGAFAALIAASDLYVGYDSGGQHIAAALGVPLVDIFVDDSIPMVTTRWTPTGSAPIRVAEHYKAPDETLGVVLEAYRALDPTPDL